MRCGSAGSGLNRCRAGDISRTARSPRQPLARKPPGNVVGIFRGLVSMTRISWNVGVFLVVSVGVAPHAVAQDWLRWGGPRGDFTIEPQGIAEVWPQVGPRQLWKRPLGEGYSAILCQIDALFT